MRRQNNGINYSQFSERFNRECQQWRSEPVMERKVNNPFCIGVFVIFTLVFFGVGGYYISVKDDHPTPRPQDLGDELILSEYAPQILSCVFGSIVVSLVYILLIKLMPAVMVIVMIFLSLGMLALLTIIGIATENYGLAIPLGIIFIVYSIVLFCFRDRIKMGIVLVKVATQFISDKPIIFLTPIVKLILTSLFAFFWIYTMSLMIQKGNEQQAAGQDDTAANVFTGIWVLMWLFYTFFFYYMMVFTIAVTCAFWYYQVQGKNPIVTAYKWIYKSAFGALVFASLLIAIITMVRMIVDSKRRGTKNIAAAVCLCLVACLLRQIEALLQILNHNTIICMAVTGQDFIDAAKSAIGIICSDFPLFSVSRLISSLLVFWGVILAVGIPSVIGFLWMDSIDGATDDLIWVLFIIIFASIMISGMILSILAQSVSCVFVFYLFDRKFRDLGFQAHNMPDDINRALGAAQMGARQSYGKLYEN